jgi:PAS domain S-box-containing protein
MDDAVYRDLFDSAPDGIVIVGRDGRITMLNDQAERMFGYAQADLVGRPIEVLVPARVRSVHSLHRSSYVEHPRTRPMGAGLQLMAKRKDGSEFPVEISLSPVETSDTTLVAAVVRDTTERRRSEDAIRAQAQLLDLAQDAIIVLGRDGAIQYWNNGAEYTYGWTAEEALGQPIEALLKTSYPGSNEHVRSTLMATGAWEGELEHTRQDGRRIAVASRMVVQRTSDGTPASIMEIDRDITERRQLERDREQLLLESDRQQDRERIGMDLHDGIIQSIYAVSLGLEAAAEDIMKDQGAAQDGVNAAIDQLSDVIRDVRSYIFELRPSRFSSDLSESFEEMIRDFQKGASMRIDAQIDQPLPALTEEARAMLFHIAREALTNARKHAAPASVRIALLNHDDAIRLEVEDDGCGFDTSAPQRDERRGLRNMQMRALANGAEFNVRSGVGVGTAIAVVLPFGEGEGPAS